MYQRQQKELSIHGSKVLIADAFAFATECPDEEVADYIFRLSWLREAPEAINFLKNFKRSFLTALLKKRIDVESPYSTAERISNICQFYDGFEEALGQEQLESLLRLSSSKLLASSEIFGSQTFNHVINSARALLLMQSCPVQLPGQVAYAKKLLNRFLPILFHNDGSNLEGSSVYQIIFTNWLLDINQCSDYFSDANNKSLFDHVMNASNDLGFHQENAAPVIFGDISPDFSIDHVRTISRIVADSFGDSPKTEKYTASTKIYNGWALCKSAGWRVIQPRNKPRNQDKLTHQHPDVGSISVSFNGTEVLIDPSRESYSKSLISINRKNNVRVNGLPIVPPRVSIIPKRLRPTVNYAEGNSSLSSRVESGVLRTTWDRSISVENSRVLIEDHLLGVEASEICWWWNLSHLLTEYEVINSGVRFVVNGQKFELVAKFSNHVNLLKLPRAVSYSQTKEAVVLQISAFSETETFFMTTELVRH